MHDNITWILDTGATDHISSKKYMFNCLTKLLKPISVYLPNGNVAKVKHSGSISLCNSIVLRDVLHISHFTYNLLFVSKLIKDSSVILFFHSHHYIIQDLLTDRVVAVGKEDGGLYKIIHRSFDVSKVHNTFSNMSVCFFYPMLCKYHAFYL